MLPKSPKSELAEIRDLQRRLRQREAEIVKQLTREQPEANEKTPLMRPGWPMQRVSERARA
jgi:hypothetical protein